MLYRDMLQQDLLGQRARSCGFLNKFDIRVEPRLVTLAAFIQTSRSQSHSHTGPVILRMFRAVMYQSLPAADKLWWNDAFSIVDITSCAPLDTVINLPSDVDRATERTVGGNCLPRGNTKNVHSILPAVKYNTILHLFFYMSTDYVVLLRSPK